jgi:hypothetical protein
MTLLPMEPAGPAITGKGSVREKLQSGRASRSDMEEDELDGLLLCYAEVSPSCAFLKTQ